MIRLARWIVGRGGRGSRGVSDDSGSRRGEELFDEAFQRRLESLSLAARRMARGRHRGERRSRKVGAGVEFADYRDYVPGDDIRYLDWSVYQRHGRLLVRLYEEEEDLSVRLLLDVSASMGFGEPPRIRYAKQMAAALAYVALGNLDRVGVTAVSDRLVAELPAVRGKRLIFRFFDFLRPLRAEGRTALGEAVRLFTARHRRPALVILLSDLYDPEGLEQALRVLRHARHEVAVLHLYDPSEESPDLAGDVLLLDAERGTRLEVTVTPRVQARYRAARTAWKEAVRRACVEQRARYVPLSLAAPFDEAVLGLLRHGMLVR